MTLAIALLSRSTRVPPATLATIAKALQIQASRDYAPEWEVLPPTVTAYDELAAVPAAAVPLVIFDEPDAPDALGYHDETPDGRVYGRVFASPIMAAGGGVLSGSYSISGTCSHELLEILGNVHVDLWSALADGRLTAREMCDAVEDRGYVIDVDGVTVSVSDFLTPAWFDPGDSIGPFSFLRSIAAPYQRTTGGYWILEQAGAISQEFGDAMPAWRRALKGRDPRVRFSALRAHIAAAQVTLSISGSFGEEEVTKP